jgi:predicted XRE-type DNA-binding protein
LLLDLRKYIRARGWTQAEAAAFFGETQPRISNLLKGEISRFSIDKLINMLGAFRDTSARGDRIRAA